MVKRLRSSLIAGVYLSYLSDSTVTFISFSRIYRGAVQFSLLGRDFLYFLVYISHVSIPEYGILLVGGARGARRGGYCASSSCMAIIYALVQICIYAVNVSVYIRWLYLSRKTISSSTMLPDHCACRLVKLTTVSELRIYTVMSNLFPQALMHRIAFQSVADVV